MNKTPKKENKAIIYQAKNGAIELQGDFSQETLWATLDQISALFGRDKSVISRHLRNIYAEGELDRGATVAKNATVQIEGNRQIKRDIEYYNLDAIISVGYRVNSGMATHFRQWATQTLRQHITKGYTINQKMIQHNYDEFQKAVDDIKQLLPQGTIIDNASVLELVTAFADTWLSLDAYDKDTLITKGVTQKSVKLTAQDLSDALMDFKKELVRKGEASELFGADHGSKSIEGIIGNVMQSFGGKDMYMTLEEKAAHLLYFIIKNHPFSDGNKRSGAYAFVWFLKKVNLLDIDRMTPPALTAITLLIAESDPKNKDRMIRLVLQLLKK